MRTKRKARWVALGLGLLVAAVFELPPLVGEAHAVVGRPLTPMSYAGVARRTSRRTTRRAVAVCAAAAPYGPYYGW